MITEILKLDENNQYGFAMIKPMPTGCIKEKDLLCWLDFHILLETVDSNVSIGHLFIVDIIFDRKNATEKQLLYNEIIPLIIEKLTNLMKVNHWQS